MDQEKLVQFDPKVDAMTVKMLRDLKRIKEQKATLEQEEKAVRDYLRVAGAALLTDGVQRARLIGPDSLEAVVYIATTEKWDGDLVERAYNTLGGSDRVNVIEKVVTYRPVKDCLEAMRRLIGKTETEPRLKALSFLQKAQQLTTDYRVK